MPLVIWAPKGLQEMREREKAMGEDQPGRAENQGVLSVTMVDPPG